VTQQQTAAAHVSASDEVDRKHEPLTENLEQHVDVFRRRDAAKQHHLAVAGVSRQRARAGLQRAAVREVCGIDICRGKRVNGGGCHEGIGSAQARIRRDDLHAVDPASAAVPVE
jgi:hypothetical protein